jgi:zinc/manganese transport system substrate-binding protein
MTGVCVLGACSTTNVASPALRTASSATVNVVAGENVWGSVAAQVGGSHVRVTSIIRDPSADPHLYASDPRDAGAIAQSRLVIVNGAGYDSFMAKLIHAAPKSGRTVLTVADILRVTGTGPNPHFWYDIPHVPEVATAIEAALAAADPPDAPAFAVNLAAFDAALRPVLDTLAEIKTRYPGAPVAYTERVPGYLLAAAGLEVKTPPGFASAIEDGNEPGPGDTQAMISLINSRAIKVLLYNSQATSPVTQHVRDLASRAGIPIVGVTETLPPTERDYQTWQFDQARALLRALGG